MWGEQGHELKVFGGLIPVTICKSLKGIQQNTKQGGRSIYVLMSNIRNVHIKTELYSALMANRAD